MLVSSVILHTSNGHTAWSALCVQQFREKFGDMTSRGERRTCHTM